MITVDELKAMPLDEPIGEAVVNDIETMAGDGLRKFIRERFKPYEGVYRINGIGEYVSEKDWKKFWSALPGWCEQVFMLHDNAHSDDYEEFTGHVLGSMTPDEIGEQYELSVDFELDCVWWTNADEDGCL